MNPILFILLLLPCFAHAGALNFDASLGSLIGDVDRNGYDGEMPFWGDFTVEQGGDHWSALIGVGHESGADTNDGNEFDINYGVIGAKYVNGWLYSKATAKRAFDGDLEWQNTVYAIELGFRHENMRFTGWWSQDEDDLYDSHGLKFGMDFELWDY